MLNMDLEQKQFIKSGIIKEIGTTPFAVYLVIQAHTDIQGVAFPSQQTIAELVGVSTKTVQRAVNKLEEEGLIQKELVRKGMKIQAIYSTNEEDIDSEVLAEELETVETQEQEQEQVRKYNNSREFIQRFCELYYEYYNVNFNPSWGRDGAMVKNKLLPIYTDEELDAILEITFRDYQKKWSNRQYPRPTLGAVCTFIANQALAIWQEEQKKQDRIERTEEMDLDRYFRNQSLPIEKPEEKPFEELSELDRRIIKGLKHVKEEVGVTYTHIGKLLGTSPASLTRFNNGEVQVLGFDKKIELMTIINQYSKIKF